MKVCSECINDPLMDRHEHPSPAHALQALAQELVPEWEVTLRATVPVVDGDFVEDAHVDLDREKKTARIRYNVNLGGETLLLLLKHELVHVLLADMDFVACNGRSVEVMEIYNLHEERVANILAKVL